MTVTVAMSTTVALPTNVAMSTTVATSTSVGYTALNIHEIWPHLLWGEHILYIRAKRTSFFNIR